jgi:CRISPR-associated protein (Cas_Cas02710)
VAKRSWIIAALKEPEKHPALFLFVITIAISVAGNGISNLILDNLCTWLSQVTVVSKIIWQIGFILAIILGLVLSIANLSTTIQRLLGKRPAYVSKVKPLEESCKGLIVFMGKRSGSVAENAILHHLMSKPLTLRYCWLICGGDEFLKNVPYMIENLPAQKEFVEFLFDQKRVYLNPENKKQELSLVLTSDQSDDPNIIRQLIEAIYTEANEKFNLSDNEVFIDYTGGTKSMTAGAILAGADPERRLQYIRSRYKNGNRVPNSEEVMEVDISYRVKPVADQ